MSNATVSASAPKNVVESKAPVKGAKSKAPVKGAGAPRTARTALGARVNTLRAKLELFLLKSKRPVTIDECQEHLEGAWARQRVSNHVMRLYHADKLVRQGGAESDREGRFAVKASIIKGAK